MSYIWNHGQFAWPFIILVVYCVAGLVACDFLWRVVKMVTIRLIGYFSITWLLGLAALAGSTADYWY
jgi:hypothetical protein